MLAGPVRSLTLSLLVVVRTTATTCIPSCSTTHICQCTTSGAVAQQRRSLKLEAKKNKGHPLPGRRLFGAVTTTCQCVPIPLPSPPPPPFPPPPLPPAPPQPPPPTAWVLQQPNVQFTASSSTMSKVSGTTDYLDGYAYSSAPVTSLQFTAPTPCCSHHTRACLTTNTADDHNCANGFMVGLWPDGRIWTSGICGSAYPGFTHTGGETMRLRLTSNEIRILKDGTLVRSCARGHSWQSILDGDTTCTKTRVHGANHEGATAAYCQNYCDTNHASVTTYVDYWPNAGTASQGWCNCYTHTTLPGICNTRIVSDMSTGGNVATFAKVYQPYYAKVWLYKVGGSITGVSMS